MNRGRPRHDDILTPREWDVLDLIREGLTNEEIAERLGVSHNTVKYHVSEILSKLGMQGRREAAAWQGRPKAAFGLAPLFAFFRESGPRYAMAAVLGVAAIGLIALTAGVIITRARDSGSPAPSSTPTTVASNATTPTTTPTVPSAPDGRTGNPAIDAVIEDFLALDAAGLTARYSGVRAQTNREGGPTMRDAWPQRLASAQMRSLHAVTRQGSRYDIYLEVITASGTLDGWTVQVLDGLINDIQVNDSTAYGPEITQANARDLVLSTPVMSLNYDSYVVLPPPADLPDPPPAHALSARTGVPGVDSLLALVEAGDAGGIEAAIASPDAFLVRECDGLDSLEGAAYAGDWAGGFVTQVRGIESVAKLPDGYSPPADHVLIFTKQVDRYGWQSVGVLERDGKVLGIITGRSCTYFADGPDYASYGRSPIAPGRRTYLIPPPAGDSELNATRNALRTGFAHVDAALDAMASGDEAALERLTQFTPVPCGSGQIGPECPEGAPAGTVVDVFPLSGCNGGAGFSHEAPTFLSNLLQDAYVYAVVENEGRWSFPGNPEADYLLVFASQGFRGTETVSIGSTGITSVRGDCGYRHPDWLIPAGKPDYLLPPP